MEFRAVSDFEHVATWAQGLLARLDPAERRRLNRKVGTDLRRSQGKRIAQQRNPDGSAYEPRKARRATKKGSIRRRAMFAKLRTARYLRVSATDTDLTVGFFGRAARIARVHQDGLVDLVERGGKSVRYPARLLLGFTDADLSTIQDSILRHLAGHST
jgi:phage virion morphogenesis protein